MRKHFATSIGCLSLLALATILYANQQDLAPGPLEVQTSTVKSAQGVDLTCSVVNTSTMDIVAYTLVAELFDSEGKPAGRLSSNAIMNLAKSTGSLAAGATGSPRRPFALPTGSDGKPVSFKVFVDYVLFKDGSTWGPDAARQSLKIMCTQEGWRQSRAQLKWLMSQRGIEAVADAWAE